MERIWSRNHSEITVFDKIFEFLRRGTSAVEACVALLLRHQPLTHNYKAQTLSIKQASLVSQEIKNSESGVLQRNWKKMQFMCVSQLPVTSLP